MHICFVTSEYPINDLPHGGVATFIRNLGYKLVNKDIQVSVILIDSNENGEAMVLDNGIKVYFLPKKSILPLKFISISIAVNKIIKTYIQLLQLILSKHPNSDWHLLKR